jgi:hypothetical protein
MICSAISSFGKVKTTTCPPLKKKYTPFSGSVFKIKDGVRFGE